MTGCPSMFSLFNSKPVTKEDVIKKIQRQYANYYQLDKSAITSVAENYLLSIATMNERISGMHQFCELSTTKIHDEYLKTAILDYLEHPLSDFKVVFKH